ncbi:MAG: hypothetical protein IT368_11950 [Candidatus Hydrogenedentes bacterium]|nr:hypothetical protein [Candidatus Hydrogenedentota bacterium]
MVEYRCDGCGVAMRPTDLRYTVTIDIRAAYDTLEVSLMDLVRSHRQEILDLIAQMEKADIRQVEEQIYKQIRLDLCPACQRAYLLDPLRFQPRRQPHLRTDFDVDTFLRSLGLGRRDDPDATDPDAL